MPTAHRPLDQDACERERRRLEGLRKQEAKSEQSTSPVQQSADRCWPRVGHRYLLPIQRPGPAVVPVAVQVQRQIRQHGRAQDRERSWKPSRTLVHIAHEVFTSLGIVYSLSYGTLFGALRYGGPVPWDADADLIILKKTIDKYSLPELQKAFSKSGVKIQWFGYGGFYLLSKNNATCDCFLFSDFYGSGWLHRVGWGELHLLHQLSMASHVPRGVAGETVADAEIRRKGHVCAAWPL